MLVWIVINEETAEVLGAFESRESALECIAINNGDKDNLCLVSEIVKARL
jgi:hypothetical protein